MTPPEKTWTLTLPDRPFDGADTQHLQKLARHAFAAGATTLILDFQSVPFIDSLAVSCLVQLVRQAPDDARVVLVNLNRSVQTIAKATRLDEILEIHGSAGETLQRIAS